MQRPVFDAQHPRGHNEEEGTVHPPEVVHVLLPQEDALGGHDEAVQGKDGGEVGHDADDLRHDGGVGRHQAGQEGGGRGEEGGEQPEGGAGLEELARELGEDVGRLLPRPAGGLGFSLGGPPEAVLLLEGAGDEGLGGQGQALAEGTEGVEDAERNGLGRHTDDTHAAADDVGHGQKERYAADGRGGDGNDVREELLHGALGGEAKDVVRFEIVLGQETPGRYGTVVALSAGAGRRRQIGSHVATLGQGGSTTDPREQPDQAQPTIPPDLLRCDLGPRLGLEQPQK
mmetsp:Transcript_19696/g.56647  ORF Transcript_19696/g.56647 Transcript_19696/m.56647 type:complete len:286 (-) Transcript_19696:483-1340(-)